MARSGPVPPAAPGWQIDPYHAKDRNYAAVRKAARFLTERGGLPSWPGRTELDAIKAAAIAAQRTALDALSEPARRKAEDRIGQDRLALLLKELNPFLAEFQA